MQRNPVTPEGYKALSDELAHAKSIGRPGIVRDIEEARAHGDLSENSEYDDAKERQSMMEGRIALLENLVASAEVIDVKTLTPSERVVFGTTVLLENAETGVERTWRIVGEQETDIPRGLISFKAPVAKAIIGRNAGDQVVIPTPGGRQVWEIVEVRYE
ncbi:MAG: transcription elongation factor GreA [Kiritimatiellia bacterium]|jgi:transcription elongation factor GreA